MNTFLKVTEVVNRKDKNGRPFQTVTFSEILYLSAGQVVLTGKTRTRNLWSSTEEIKGDTLYNQLQVGSMVEGSIQSFDTTAFEIEAQDGTTRSVNKTTVVVFGFENPIAYANAQLKRNNACVVNEHGEPTANVSFKQAEKLVAEVAGDEESDF